MQLKLVKVYVCVLLFNTLTRQHANSLQIGLAIIQW